MAFAFALHSRLFFTLVVFFAGLAIWGIINAARNSSPSQRYLGAIVVGELAIALEGTLGLILLAGGLQPGQLLLHLMYGVAGLLVLPIAGFFTRRLSPRHQYVVLAIVCLLLCGLAFRSQSTGRAAVPQPR